MVAAKYCDVLFTTISNIENGKRHIEALREGSDRSDRRLSIYTPVHIVCRDTLAAAEAYYDHYTTEFGDHGAVDTYIAENSRSGKPALAAAMKLQRKRIAGGFGSYGIVGSPGDVAEQILQLREAGFCGISVSFVDFVGIAALPRNGHAAPGSSRDPLAANRLELAIRICRRGYGHNPRPDH